MAAPTPQPVPAGGRSTCTALGEPGSSWPQPHPSWPTLGRGPEADPAGSPGLFLPTTRARGCMGASQSPGGCSRGSCWAELLRAWTPAQGAGSHRKRLAARSSCGGWVRAWVQVMAWPAQQLPPVRACPAGCGLFI